MSGFVEMGSRRFGRWNWLGLYTLAHREIMRFLKVWTQTILAPMVTAALFLAVFTLALGGFSRGEVMGVPFLAFLTPGIVMMTIIQNAFANTSSSIMISKVQGNIVDTLMPPLSPMELVLGFASGGVVRGVFVALTTGIPMLLIAGSGVAHPLWALVFVVLGASLLSGLGILAAIYAEKFDQMAAITNFIVTPLAFLSGTFYSVERLPATFQAITHLNPVFYLIDGLRYGTIGQSDSSPVLGLIVCTVTTGLVFAACWHFFRSGYRLKA